MSKGFIKLPKDRGFITIPAIIFEDERLSIGAKGLYVQLFNSNNEINSLEDLTKLTTSTKEEIDAWFVELNEVGYISVNKDGSCSMNMKTQGEKTVARKLNKEAVEQFANKTVEPQKPLSKYDKIVGLITTQYDFPTNVKQLLIAYFEKRLSKKGRFIEADELHSGTVRGMLGDLISFHMSEDDMITCIQQSIDKEWFKFVDHRLSSNPAVNTSTNKASSFKPFDKSNITSGSYTEEEAQSIKERAEALEAEGKKGLF